LRCRGIRGAITVPTNQKQSIVQASKELLLAMAEANDVQIDDIAAIFFTTTADLNTAFPAVATRELGWPHYMALLCGHEMNVAADLPRCLRILMLVNTEKKPEDVNHVYLGEAKRLKEDPLPPPGGDS